MGDAERPWGAADVEALADLVLDGIGDAGLVVVPAEVWGVGHGGGRVAWHPSEPDGFAGVCAVDVGPVRLHMDGRARCALSDEIWSQGAPPPDMTAPPVGVKTARRKLGWMTALNVETRAEKEEK